MKNFNRAVYDLLGAAVGMVILPLIVGCGFYVYAHRNENPAAMLVLMLLAVCAIAAIAGAMLHWRAGARQLELMLCNERETTKKQAEQFGGDPLPDPVVKVDDIEFDGSAFIGPAPHPSLIYWAGEHKWKFIKGTTMLRSELESLRAQASYTSLRKNAAQDGRYSTSAPGPKRLREVITAAANGDERAVRALVNLGIDVEGDKQSPATPRNADNLSASEALFGFMSWLTTRPDTLEIGAQHEAGQFAVLVAMFLQAQGLSDPAEDWTQRLVPMGDRDVRFSRVEYSPESTFGVTPALPIQLTDCAPTFGVQPFSLGESLEEDLAADDLLPMPSDLVWPVNLGQIPQQSYADLVKVEHVAEQSQPVDVPVDDAADLEAVDQELLRKRGGAE